MAAIHTAALAAGPPVGPKSGDFRTLAQGVVNLVTSALLAIEELDGLTLGTTNECGVNSFYVQNHDEPMNKRR
jgi:hypothetical protein